MIKVSACLLTYNRAGWIKQTLETIRAQTLCDFELVISDNASSDETERICRDFERVDERIRYYRNRINLGMTGNYQAALERTTGAYIAFLHDNDLFHPDLLAKWASALDRYPSAALVFNSLEAIDFENRHVRYWFHPYPSLIRPGMNLLDDMLTRWGSPVHGMVMMRSSVVDAVGPFDWKRFPNLGDVDMWMRLAGRFDVAYVREPLIRVRVRERNHFADTWSVQEELYQLHRLNICRRYDNDPPGMQEALKKLDRRRLPYWFRQILSQVRRGQFERAVEGITVFKRSSSLTLQIVARLISLFCARLCKLSISAAPRLGQ